MKTYVNDFGETGRAKEFGNVAIRVYTDLSAVPILDKVITYTVPMMTLEPPPPEEGSEGIPLPLAF